MSSTGWNKELDQRKNWIGINVKSSTQVQRNQLYAHRLGKACLATAPFNKQIILVHHSQRAQQFDMAAKGSQWNLWV